MAIHPRQTELQIRCIISDVCCGDKHASSRPPSRLTLGVILYRSTKVMTPKFLGSGRRRAIATNTHTGAGNPLSSRGGSSCIRQEVPVFGGTASTPDEVRPRNRQFGRPPGVTIIALVHVPHTLVPDFRPWCHSGPGLEVGRRYKPGPRDNHIHHHVGWTEFDLQVVPPVAGRVDECLDGVARW